MAHIHCHSPSAVTWEFGNELDLPNLVIQSQDLKNSSLHILTIISVGDVHYGKYMCKTHEDKYGSYTIFASISWLLNDAEEGALYIN